MQKLAFRKEKGYTECMRKKLSEMTLKELWQLFPIVLTEHKTCWKEWYEQEAAALVAVLPQGANVYHIGSTAIEGIRAKPIVDILAEIPLSCALPQAAERIASLGYIVMARSDTRISLNKGYTENGFAERVFHVHVQYVGNKDEVYFRDYLLAHPTVAAQYERLKLSLWKRYEHDRDAYTAAKSDFVRKYTEKAKQER